MLNLWSAALGLSLQKHMLTLCLEVPLPGEGRLARIDLNRRGID